MLVKVAQKITVHRQSAKSQLQKHFFQKQSKTKQIFFKKLLTNQFTRDIIYSVNNKGELCNGSTADSDSVCWGSNPYSPAKNPAR